MTTPALLTVEEAAEVLRCSVRTLQRRISSGELRAYRDGRIVRVPADELRTYVRQHLASSIPPERAEGRGRPLPPGSRLWAA